MRIFIASEFRCTEYNNEYYLAPKAYSIYKRYADVFGKIILCCRFEKTNVLTEGYHKAGFINDVIKIEKLLKTAIHGYDKEILQKISECDLVIGRLPSIIGYRASDCAHKLKKKYLAECMGDAWDAYWNHSLLGKIIAPYMFFKMKCTVAKAEYALYVTDFFLQKRYPNSKKIINASNVVINSCDPEVLNKRLKKIQKFNKRKFSLMTTAGVNIKAKGHRFVIKAIVELKKQGIIVDYYLAGGGDPYKLKKLAKKNGVENQIHFMGELTMKDVYQTIDNIDIYIQPSLQEGLPRAVIEAMSRGCPCLGSNTAGTPELLPSECIFDRGSTRAVCKALKKINESNLKQYAIQNYEKSKCYLEDTLNQRRTLFLNNICIDIEKRGSNSRDEK